MKWRKINRIIHRDLGYFFFGMTVIYAVSGIVLNHRNNSGDLSVVTTNHEFIFNAPVSRSNADRNFVDSLLKLQGVDQYKQFYFPSSTTMMIYLDGGHVNLDLVRGTGNLVKVRKLPVLTEFNFLHYNKPKKLWTWFSDSFAVSWILIAVTGLFILKGKKGITGRGALFATAGIIVPLIFLFLYLWTS